MLKLPRLGVGDWFKFGPGMEYFMYLNLAIGLAGPAWSWINWGFLVILMAVLSLFLRKYRQRWIGKMFTSSVEMLGALEATSAGTESTEIAFDWATWKIAIYRKWIARTPALDAMCIKLEKLCISLQPQLAAEQK